MKLSLSLSFILLMSNQLAYASDAKTAHYDVQASYQILEQARGQFDDLVESKKAKLFVTEYGGDTRFEGVFYRENAPAQFYNNCQGAQTESVRDENNQIKWYVQNMSFEQMTGAVNSIVSNHHISHTIKPSGQAMVTVNSGLKAGPISIYQFQNPLTVFQVNGRDVVLTEIVVGSVNASGFLGNQTDDYILIYRLKDSLNQEVYGFDQLRVPYRKPKNASVVSAAKAYITENILGQAEKLPIKPRQTELLATYNNLQTQVAQSPAVLNFIRCTSPE